MLDVLEFVFRSFWTFAGTICLLFVIGLAGSMIVAPLATIGAKRVVVERKDEA